MTTSIDFNLPKISLGMPIFNAESFLRQRLDSILNQTFTNFELIISDNASTDSTQRICEEYSKKDKRIRYFRQTKNMGVTYNFNFVLEQASYEYFIWVAADDLILPKFLEENIRSLELNKNYIASISKIESYTNSRNDDPIDRHFSSFVKKLRKTFKSMGVNPISGSYEKKVRTYLTKSTCQIIYGVFRTESLRKSIIQNPFVGNDWAIILNILRYGDFNVIDQVLMYEFEGGITAGGIINSIHHYNYNLLKIIFPWYPFTFWCARNLGSKIFIKNIDFFFRLNLEGVISLSIDLTRRFLHRISR